MAIEQLGESLLAQARKKSKKEERKAKLFTGLLLGVQAGNHILRNRAKKRAETFLVGNQGLINQRTKQFNDGVTFWSDHKKMLDTYGSFADATTGEDWVKAKTDLLMKQYQDSPQYKNLKITDPTEYNNIVQGKIKDDIEAYRTKLDLFQNLRNVSKDDKAAEAAFMAPIQSKINKGLQIINNESSTGGWLLSNLGLRPSAKLITEEVNGQKLILPEGFDGTEKKELVREIGEITDNLTAARKAVGIFDPLTEEEVVKITRPKTTFKPSVKIDTSLQSIGTSVLAGDDQYEDLGTTVNGKEFSYTTFLNQFEITQDTKSEGVKLTDVQKEGIISDALRIAQYNKAIQNELAKEEGYGALAIPEGGDRFFFDQAMQQILENDFSVYIGGWRKDEPRGKYTRQTLKNYINKVGQEGFTITTLSQSGKQIETEVGSEIIDRVIGDAQKENILTDLENQTMTADTIVNRYQQTVLSNPDYKNAPKEIKYQIYTNLVLDYPQFKDELLNEFLKTEKDKIIPKTILKPEETSDMSDEEKFKTLEDKYRSQGVEELSLLGRKFFGFDVNKRMADVESAMETGKINFAVASGVNNFIRKELNRKNLNFYNLSSEERNNYLQQYLNYLEKYQATLA